MARVLGRLRLSRDTDASTSIDRQRESIETWCRMHGHVIIGWAEDVDLSGSVSPFEAPALKPWFNERVKEWDMIVAYRLDRIARRVVPLNALFGWCQDNGKTLASVSEQLDLSSWVGRLVANVIAGVAEGELEAITERNRSSREKLRKLGRFPGGITPYGYKSVGRDGGRYLEIDEGEAEVVRRIFDRACENRSANSIMHELNEDGVKPRKAEKWTVQTVLGVLRERAVLGQLANRDKPILDEEGMPIQRADPIISYQQWKQVQTILARNYKPKTRSKTPSPLSGLLFCMRCEGPMYLVVSKPDKDHRYYRCRRKVEHKTCEVSPVRAGEVEAIIDNQILDRIGEVECQERIYEVGSSHEDELNQVEAAIATVRKEKDLGLYEGDEDSYLERLQTLVKRRDALKETPQTEPGYRWRGLGETYREAWERMGVEEWRSLLLNSGVWMQAEGSPLNTYVYIPEDLLEQAFPGYEYQQREPEDLSQYGTVG